MTDGHQPKIVYWRAIEDACLIYLVESLQADFKTAARGLVHRTDNGCDCRYRRLTAGLDPVRRSSHWTSVAPNLLMQFEENKTSFDEIRMDFAGETPDAGSQYASGSQIEAAGEIPWSTLETAALSYMSRVLQIQDWSKMSTALPRRSEQSCEVHLSRLTSSLSKSGESDGPKMWTPEIAAQYVKMYHDRLTYEDVCEMFQ